MAEKTKFYVSYLTLDADIREVLADNEDEATVTVTREFPHAHGLVCHRERPSEDYGPGVLIIDRRTPPHVGQALAHIAMLCAMRQNWNAVARLETLVSDIKFQEMRKEDTI